jgi:hypothetical protein
VIKKNQQGLPPEWGVLLKCNNISASDVKENPKEVLDVLSFHQGGNRGKPPPNAAVEGDIKSGELMLVIFSATSDPLFFFERPWVFLGIFFLKKFLDVFVFSSQLCGFDLLVFL